MYLSDVPVWPRITATTREDGSGVVTIDGTAHAVETTDREDARTEIVGRIADTAAKLARPVRVSTSGTLGEWTLIVHPDGGVEEGDDRSVRGGTVPGAGRRVAPQRLARRQGERAWTPSGPPAPLGSSTASDPLEVGAQRRRRRWILPILGAASLVAVVVSVAALDDADREEAVTTATSTTPTATADGVEEQVTFQDQPNGTCFNRFFGRDSSANGETLDVVACTDPLARTRLLDHGATEEVLPRCEGVATLAFSGDEDSYCFETVFRAGLCVPGYDLPEASAVYLNYPMSCSDDVAADALGVPAGVQIRKRVIESVTTSAEDQPCPATATAYDVQETAQRVCLRT